MRANYHTHTVRCLHAEGREEEYVRQALRAGFSVLGFSDHCPWPYPGGFVSGIRMRAEEMKDYCRTVRQLKERYSDRMRIYLGLECEYFPAYMDWQRRQAADFGLDYLILGNHYDETDETGIYFGHCTRPAQLLRYAEQTVAGLETGMFACLAHPDLALNSYPVWDDACREMSERLCEAALRLDIPLEYNLLGYTRRMRGTRGLGYTTDGFWKIAAARGVKAVLGVDAHRPAMMDCAAEWERARSYLTGLGVQVLDALPGLE